MPIKLYKADVSPPARAAIMACEIFKVPVEMIDVDFSKGEHRTSNYLKMNPTHTVPVLVDDDLVIHDSHAILMYLAEAYGNNNSFYPKDIKERAKINQKLFFNNSILFPRMRNVTYPAFIEGVKGLTEKKITDIEEAYDFLEAFLGQSKYLAGENVTLADIAALPTVCGLAYIVPLKAERHPKISAWLKDMEQKPYSQKCNATGAKALGEYVQSMIKG